MKYQVVLSNRYKRDLKRLAKSGVNLRKLEATIHIIASGAILPMKYRDHELKGKLTGVRECHIAPDWLLMYANKNDNLVLVLLRTGTHRDVLGIE